MNAVRGEWEDLQSRKVQPGRQIIGGKGRILSVRKMMNTGQLVTGQILEFPYDATEPICRNQRIQTESPPFLPQPIPP